MDEKPAPKAKPAPKSAPKRTRRRAPPATNVEAEAATGATAEATTVVAAPTEHARAPQPRGPRRIVLTGGAGFVGGAVARVLRERGDVVVALVRDAKRAPALVELGAEIVEDDLSDVGRLREALHEADAVIHAAGSYRIGITKAKRGAMWDANVGTTTRILDAVEAAATPRIVYVSTVNVFGNTHGRIVDETYRRNLAEDFLSWYDETKYGAHEVAEQRIRDGAPVVIALPSQVYGPGDRSSVGDQLGRAHAGKLPYRAVDDVGLGFVHVDDLAAGMVTVLDRGAVGRSYVLSGPTTTLAEAIRTAAEIGGRTPPALRIPTGLLRAMTPLGGLIGQPNLAEVISSSAGVTYWASAARASEELGWEARGLEAGLRDTFGAA
jgi:dihydroflavonol-4-reductase